MPQSKYTLTGEWFPFKGAFLLKARTVWMAKEDLFANPAPKDRRSPEEKSKEKSFIKGCTDIGAQRAPVKHGLGTVCG